MSFEFRHLRYFVAAAEELSLNRAAMRLGLSQPTLNRQLSELEDKLGVQLLWRSRQGVRLTEAGQEFLELARGLLWEQADLGVAIRETGATKMTVAYLASTVFGPVGEAIADMRQSRPWLHLDLVEASPGPALEQVATGQADLAFVGTGRGEITRMLRLGLCTRFRWRRRFRLTTVWPAASRCDWPISHERPSSAYGKTSFRGARPSFAGSAGRRVLR